MGDTTTDELDDVDETDELDEDATEETSSDEDADELDDEDDGDPDEDAEAQFTAALNPAQLKFYNARKTQLTKARADAGRQRRKIRRLSTTEVKPTPKPTAPKRKTTADAPLSKDELLAELRQEMETKAQTDRVTGMAERKLESLLSLPTDPDVRERKLSRVLKMLDLNGCTSAADVADAIADLKDDSPELFRRKRAKPKTGGVGGPAKATGAGAKAPDKIGALFED